MYENMQSRQQAVWQWHLLKSNTTAAQQTLDFNYSIFVLFPIRRCSMTQSLRAEQPNVHLHEKKSRNKTKQKEIKTIHRCRRSWCWCRWYSLLQFFGGKQTDRQPEKMQGRQNNSNSFRLLSSHFFCLCFAFKTRLIFIANDSICIQFVNRARPTHQMPSKQTINNSIRDQCEFLVAAATALPSVGQRMPSMCVFLPTIRYTGTGVLRSKQHLHLRTTLVFYSRLVS